MIDEKRIQLALFRELMSRGNYAAIPNVSWSWLYWEADMIGISKAWYSSEYEIKISHQDFKRDFKKRKHYSMKRGQIRTYRMPNYFYYVAPLKAIPICIPDHTGLMLVEENKYGLKISNIKSAPRLHDSKIEQENVLAIFRTLMFKYWDLSQTLDTRKIQKQIYSEMLSN